MIKPKGIKMIRAMIPAQPISPLRQKCLFLPSGETWGESDGSLMAAGYLEGRGSQAAITLWRDCDQLATLIHLESPALFVHQPVMTATEKDQVIQGRRTAIGPMLDVMRIRPRGRAVTAGKPAAFVSGDQCTPRGTRHHTAGVVGR